MSEVQRLRVAIARADRLLMKHGGGDGLTRTQFSVLGAVARADAVRISELCTREGLNPTMLSRVVGNLEAEGFVTRRPADDDGRQIVAQITRAGAARYRRHQAERDALLENFVATLEPNEVKRLWQALPLLEALADHLQGLV